MIKVIVKNGFYDVKEDCFRPEDSEFEVSKDRFNELQERLPGFVEKVSQKKKKEELSDELPI